MIKASLDALSNCTSPRFVAAKRGKKVSEIIGRREEAPAAQEQASG
jgi:small subunit ribosomal protein S5